jgi:ABC-type lipoprotein release transport system permease subunit
VNRVTGVRGPLTVRRLTAQWVVLAAAALTTLVAAAVGAALAAFAGQALPQAVRHDLVVAPGTSLAATGKFVSGNPAQTTAVLRSSIATALDGVPFGFWPGIRSDPLGFVAGSLPAKPASLTPGNTPLLQAAALTGVANHAVLVTGKWPGRAAGGAIPAALPASTAALLKLRPGDVIRVEDQDNGAQLTFILTGLYAERQSPASAASYWRLNSIPASGSSTASGSTTYGPLVVSPSVFPGRLTEGTGIWVAQPDMAGFNASDLSAIAAHLGAIGYTSSLLSGITLTTNLPTVLADTGDNLAVARSLLAISVLELLVLTVAALLAVARLLTAQREGETALLTARGATRWQLTRLSAAEVIPLSLVTALIGGTAGIWLARLLASNLYRPGTAGVPNGGISVGAAGTWLDALAAALAIAVVAIGALLYPVLRPGRDAAQVRRGRQALISGATRAGADLALVALAVLACWQLRRYSAVSTSASGPSAIDPVLVLAPALALAAGTVLTLRLLPAAARVADRVSAAGRGLTSALAGWQFSRQPLRQGGAALLLVMAVATGTLALAQHQSWTRSAADQAAYVTGGDAQVNLAGPRPAGTTTSITGAAGVQAAMAVSVSQATPAPVVAIDAAQASKVARLRADQSSLPPAALLRSITPSSPSGGLLIGGRPRSVPFTVTLSRAPLDSVTAQFTVTDRTGAAFQLSSALFTADGRPHVLTASLGGADAAYPLRLSQVILNYTLPAKRLKTPVTLTIAGATPSTWTAAASSPELASQLSTDNVYGPSAEPQVTGWERAPGGAALTFTPGYGQWSPAPGASPVLTEPVAGQVTLSAPATGPAAVPAIATRAFDRVNNAGVGSVVQTTINGLTVPAKIVATASAFPTITGAGLVVDLPTLESYLVSHGATPVSVTQWWLATAGGRVPASLTRALPPGATVTSSAAVAAATVADPLSAAPQQALLAMAVAAALLAISGFWVSIAANVRQRRAENALLAALGVNQRSAAAQLFMEKLLFSVPAAALGLLLGTVVARLLVPAVTLSPTAQIPVPAPITLFDLPLTIPLAAAVAVLPALTAALVVFRRPDPAAELRAVEAA